MVLDVAIASAEADLADAHAELIAAQQQLIDLVRLPIGEPAPWPVDRPLAGQYETHFGAIFATRPATGRIRAIDQMLPSKHDAVEARAGAVVAAKLAMDRAENRSCSSETSYRGSCCRSSDASAAAKRVR